MNFIPAAFGPPPIPRQKAALRTSLSPREIQCISLCAKGNTDVEIASMLGVTRHAVRFHISNIMTKMHAANRAHAVFLACMSGLFSSAAEDADREEMA